MKKEVNAQQTQQTEEEIQVIPEESKGRKILNTVINVLLVIAIIVAAICTYVSFVSSSGNGVPSVFGLQMFSIQTESMYPVLKPGDLIFDKAVSDPATLQKGDIITYWTVINGERVLNTHEIFEIYDGGDYRIFATKGKNNNSVDSLTVHESEVVGKYWFRVGGVGKVFDYLQTSTGFLLVVVLPVFAEPPHELPEVGLRCLPGFRQVLIVIGECHLSVFAEELNFDSIHYFHSIPNRLRSP